VITLRPDDEHLDLYERWARDCLERLEPRLGQLRVLDRKGGPPGLHDLEAGGPDAPVAAIEVTSAVESQRLGVESEIRQRGLSSFPLPGLMAQWSVRLTDQTQVRVASRRDKLQPLLSDLEAGGARCAHDMGDYRDPVVKRLRELGIAAVYRLSTGRGGGVVMGTDAYGGFEWDGPAIDAWLDEFLASDQGANKLAKLGRAKAAERHLALVLASFSQPGIGIPLKLSSRRDVGAAAYVMPSYEPPAPLSHMWLLPMAEGSEGLRWARGSGWAVLAV
jgi:hypothetical protein